MKAVTYNSFGSPLSVLTYSDIEKPEPILGTPGLFGRFTLRFCIPGKSGIIGRSGIIRLPQSRA